MRELRRSGQSFPLHDPHDCCNRVEKVLSRYFSESYARAILGRALRIRSFERRTLRPADVPQLIAAVEQCAEPFLDSGKLLRLSEDLQALELRKVAPIQSERIEVHSEHDVSAARTRARSFVATLGGTPTDIVKVATLVSELARNIVLYTPGGYLEFVLEPDPTRIIVLAVDQGPGIPHLDDVLAGTYKSQTGLGRGLIGVQRLAHRFEVETSKQGTRIKVEVRL